MSRRHQGGRTHRSGGHGRPSAAPLAAPSPDSQRYRPEASEPARVDPPGSEAPGQIAGEPRVPFSSPPASPSSVQTGMSEAAAATPVQSPATPMSVAPPFAQPQSDGVHGPSNGATCTAPQLRRFIKSRPYVPMHELRRRFAINGDDDDVTAVDLADGRVFVGLPAREGDLLGELLRGGEVGFELSLDPRSPIVVGLYPMRPIPRS